MANSISEDLSGRRRVNWPDRLIEVADEFGRGQFAAPPTLPAIAFQAWLQPDVLLAALHRQVDLESDDKHALSAGERHKRQATIAADRLATEREEEFWIDQSRAAGHAIARRIDADPPAVLGLSSDLLRQKTAFKSKGKTLTVNRNAYIKEMQKVCALAGKPNRAQAFIACNIAFADVRTKLLSERVDLVADMRRRQCIDQPTAKSSTAAHRWSTSSPN